MEIFRAYIDVFGPKMGVIGSRWSSELISFDTFPDASSPCTEAQERFHMVNKRQAPDCNTLGPFLLAIIGPICQVFLYPSFMATSQLSIGTGTRQPLESPVINQYVLSLRALDLIIPTERPHRWMIHNTRTDHIGVNISNASQQMFPALYSGGMITVFPISSFSALSLIVFLSGSTGHQLHRLRDGVATNNHCPDFPF